MPISNANDPNESPNTHHHDNLNLAGRNGNKLTYPRILALTKNLPTHSKFFQRESINRKDEISQMTAPSNINRK